MKRIFALILALTLVLCGCGSNAAETGVPTTQAPVTEPVNEAPTTVPASEEPTAAPSETASPTEAAPVDTNPLTGEALDAISNARPIAVMINNSSKALPQCGIGQADILYEVLSEGSTTRFMAIFTDVSNITAIGPIRSVRPYFFKLMQGYDAICTSAGGSEEAYTLVYGTGWDYMNGINGDSAGYFYRDDARREERGYEHSLFIKGARLIGGATKLGMRVNEKEGMRYNLIFDDSVALEGSGAGKITVHFRSSGKTTQLTYHADTGVYTAYQQERDLTDGLTGQAVPFRNVLVLWSESYVEDDEGHLYVQTTGEGTGYYARDGKIIPIKWSRENESSPFVYTDEAGNPITFGVGKSYIAILPNGSPVDIVE